MGLAVTGAAIVWTGGSASPAWIYLYFLVVFASSFYEAPVVLGYMTGCAITMLLPLLYDAHATRGAFVGECMIAVPSFLVLSGAIVAGPSVLSQSGEPADRLATEPTALRRLAT